MDASLCKHIKKLNRLSYDDQRVYLAKKLISIKPDDILHFTFLKTTNNAYRHTSYL